MVVEFLASGKKTGKTRFVTSGITYSKMCSVLYRKKRITKFSHPCRDYHIAGGQMQILLLSQFYVKHELQLPLLYCFAAFCVSLNRKSFSS